MLGGPDNARGFFENVNEIGAGWFLWALRDSAAATGHHASAIEADRFYRRLADEVNSACARGVLSCNVERSSLRPPFDRTQLEPFGVALLTVSGFVPQLLATSTGGPVRDLGTREQLGAAEAFVNDRLATGPATLPVVEPLETMGDVATIALDHRSGGCGLVDGDTSAPEWPRHYATQTVVGRAAALDTGTGATCVGRADTCKRLASDRFALYVSSPSPAGIF